MLDVNYFFHGTRIIEGCGVLNQVGDEAKALNAKKALIVTDAFLSKTEFYETIKNSLENAGVQAVLGTNVKPNPRATDCDEMAKMAKGEGVDLVIAFGGGSAMDQAKTVASLLTNGKTAVEWGDVELENNIMPLFCIPTTSGTGSEVTFCAVITDEKRHYKMTVGDPVHMIPTLAICDPEVTLNLPKPLTAACGVDALTHAIEAYTVKVHQPLTNALALKSISMISENLVLAYEDGQNREARRNMMIASTMAGMAFISSNVGAVHAIAETVGAWFDTPHGVANSLFLPYVMEYNIPACTNRFVDVSKALGVVRKEGMTDFDYAIAGVEFIKELNRKLNIPTLKDLSEISVDKFEQIAKKSAANVLSNDNAKDIGEDEYLEILNKAYMGYEKICENA
ncbi:iron-containing alcohol dehydrogenase [Clostridium sp.]|uniref:iron-containing alcohol dehydrogenase n=1 Tax=Clostridium sp. TaxID=1506 RepID=UPI0025C2A895|nr:iron-containing alcohol dehydrogenase [Clostridium sp.]